MEKQSDQRLSLSVVLVMMPTSQTTHSLEQEEITSGLVPPLVLRLFHKLLPKLRVKKITMYSHSDTTGTKTVTTVFTRLNLMQETSDRQIILVDPTVLQKLQTSIFSSSTPTTMLQGKTVNKNTLFLTLVDTQVALPFLIQWRFQDHAHTKVSTSPLSTTIEVLTPMITILQETTPCNMLRLSWMTTHIWSTKMDLMPAILLNSTSKPTACKSRLTPRTWLACRELSFVIVMEWTDFSNSIFI